MPGSVVGRLFRLSGSGASFKAIECFKASDCKPAKHDPGRWASVVSSPPGRINVNEKTRTGTNKLRRLNKYSKSSNDAMGPYQGRHHGKRVLSSVGRSERDLLCCLEVTPRVRVQDIELPVGTFGFPASNWSPKKKRKTISTYKVVRADPRCSKSRHTFFESLSFTNRSCQSGVVGRGGWVVG